MADKLKICVVSPMMNVFGGGHMSLLTLIDYLQKKDIEIKVIFPEGGEMQGEFQRRGIEYREIPFEKWVLLPVEKGKELEEKPMRLFTSALEISRIIREWKSDIIYTNTSVVNVGALAATILNIPHVWHVRESIKHHEAHKPMMPFEALAEFMNATTNHFFFISKPLAEDYKGFIAESKYDVVYNYLSRTESNLKKVDEALKFDIIVPYYNDKDTIKCLESVKRHQSKSINKVLVISDCGPDEEMNKKVEDYCKSNKDLFELIKTDKNGGYVYACNWGMRLSKLDVIILTTDTVVTSGWAEKMKQVAYQESNIGTVTPLSSSANIFSVPEPHFNEDNDPDLTNEILEKFSAVDYIDVFTMHGFCSYIKREVIEKIGMYDYEKYTYGYGEENDFSMRAAKAGYKAVIATKAFVKHIGGQSFGSERRKMLMEQNSKKLKAEYPHYKSLWQAFVDKDELKDIRSIVKEFKKYPNLINEPKAVLTGTFETNKGQLDAVKAVAKLKEGGKLLHVIFIGRVAKEDYYSEVMDFVKNHDIEDRVHHLGALENNYVYRVLENADFYLMCSRSEAFGRVTAEAMLAGIPVIGTNRGGTTELVEEGVRGLLYEPEDIVGLVGQITKLLENPKLKEKMGKNAYEYINEMMNLESYAGKIHDVFMKIKEERENELILSKFFSPWMLNKYFEIGTVEMLADHFKTKLRGSGVYSFLKDIKSKVRR